MTMTRAKKVRTVLLAVLLVTTAMAGPMAGTAVAQTDDGGEACGFDDWVAHVTSFGFVESDCMSPEEVDQEWNETDAKQTRTQIHSQAGQLAAGNEQFLTVQQNLLTDSDTAAFSRGEAAAVETLANGGTEQEAIEAAKAAVEDYYTTKQRNLIDRWDVNVETVKTLNSRAENTSGVSSDFVTGANETTLTGSADVLVAKSSRVSGTTTKTVTLVNGSSVVSKQLEMVSSVNVGNAPNGLGYYEEDSNYVLSPSANLRINSSDFAVQGSTVDWTKDNIGYDYSPVLTTDRIKIRPTTDLASTRVVDVSDFSTTWYDIKERTTETKEEVGVYVNQSLGPAVENGNLNATSYVSPATLAQEYSQDYNGSESYVHATALAAYNGFDTPNLDQTASMTISHDGETYTGLILSQEAPSGGWQANQQYDPALLSGIQMFAVSNSGNSSGMIELDGPFSITSIEGTNGEQIEEATTVNITYQTSNASANYTEMQQEIRSLNEKIEQRQNTIGGGGGGGGGDDGGGGSSNLIVGGVLLGGVALIVVGMRGSG